MLVCQKAIRVHGQRKVGNPFVRTWVIGAELGPCFIDHCLPGRGGRSHFFRLRSCSKIFETGSGSEIFSNLRIRLLFRRRLQSMQPKSTNLFTWEITTQTPATTEIENCLRVRFFTNFWLRIWIRKKNAEPCRSRLRIHGRPCLPGLWPEPVLHDGLWAQFSYAGRKLTEQKPWIRLKAVASEPCILNCETSNSRDSSQRCSGSNDPNPKQKPVLIFPTRCATVLANHRSLLNRAGKSP